MKKNPVTLSMDALTHMKQIVTSQRPVILIGVNGGGCNGLKYYIKAVGHPDVSDDAFVYEGVNIAMCGKSLIHLLGTHITMKNDEMGSRIEFENPNASSSCGCGETFNVNN